MDSRQDSLDGGSARRKAATYVGQHKRGINADIHTSSRIRIHGPNIWAGNDSHLFCTILYDYTRTSQTIELY
jgi:hypothetical protein